MPLEAAHLFARVSADTGEAESGLARVGSLFTGLAQTLASPVTGLANFAANAGFAVFGIQSLVGAAQSGMSALFSMNAMLEQSGVAFTTLTGTADEASKVMQDLQQFAAFTPFEFPELAKSTQLMMAFGFAAQDTLPMLTAVGDAVSAMGGGSVEVQRVVRALGQMNAATRVTAEDMNQLTEVGIGGWRILSEQLGISTAKVREMSEKGLIPASVAIPALLRGMQDTFGGSMAQQAKTFTGMMSTLRDNIRQAMAAFMGPAFEQAKAGLQALVRLTSDPAFAQFARDMGEKVGAAAAWVANTAIPALIEAWNQLSPAVNAAIQSLQGVWQVFEGLMAEGQGWGLNIIGSVAQGILDGVAMIAGALQAVGDVIAYWLQPGSPPRVAPKLDIWGTAAIQEFINGMGNGNWDIFNAISSQLETVIRDLGAMGNIPETGIVPAILGGREAIMQALQQLQQTGTIGQAALNKIAAAAGPAGDDIRALMLAMVDLSAVEQQMRQIQEELSAATEEYDSILDGLGSQLEALRDQYDATLKGLASELDSTREAFDGLLDGLRDQLESARDSYDGILGGLRDQLDQTRESYDNLLGGLRDQLDQTRESFDNVLGSLRDQLEQTRESFDGVLEGIKSQLDQVKDSYASLLDNLNRQLEEQRESYAALLEPLTREFNRLRDQYETVLGGLNDQLDRVRDQYEDVLGGLTDELKRVRDEFDSQISPYDDRLSQIEQEQRMMRENEQLARLNAIAQDESATTAERRSAALEAEEILLRRQRDALVSQRDDAVEGIQDRIDGVTAERDAALKAIQDRIDATKAERDQQLEFYQRQIEWVTEERDLRLEAIAQEIEAVKERAAAEIEPLQRQIEEQQRVRDLALRAIQEQIEAVQEQRNTAVEAIEDQIQATQRQRDAAVGAIEDQIEAVNRRREAELGAIQDQIDAAQEQRDASIEAIQDRIEATQAERDAAIEAIEAQREAIQEQRDAATEAAQARLDELNAQREAIQAEIDMRKSQLGYQHEQIALMKEQQDLLKRLAEEAERAAKKAKTPKKGPKPKAEKPEFPGLKPGFTADAGINALDFTPKIDERMLKLNEFDDLGNKLDLLGEKGGRVQEVMNRFKSTIQDVRDSVTPLVRLLLDNIPTFLQMGAAFGGFQLVMQGVALLGPEILNLGTFFGGLLRNIALLISPMTTFSALWSGLVAIFGFLLSPITLIGLALGAFAYAFITNTAGVRDQVMPILMSFVEMFQRLWQHILDASVVIQPAISAIGSALTSLAPIGGAIVAVLLTGLGALVNMFIEMLPGAIQFFAGAFQVVAGIIEVVASLIVGVFKGVYALLNGDTQGFKDAMVAMWDSMKNGIVNIGRGLWNLLAGLWNTIVNGIIGFAQYLYDILIGHSIIPDIVNGIVRWFINLWTETVRIYNLIKNAILSAWMYVKDNIITPILTTIGQFIEDWITGPSGILARLDFGWQLLQYKAKVAFAYVLNEIVIPILSGVLNFINTWITGPTGVIPTFQRGWDTVLDATRRAWEWLQTRIIEPVIGTLSDLFYYFLFRPAGEGSRKGVIRMFYEAWQALEETTKVAWDWLEGMVISPALNAIRQVIDGALNSGNGIIASVNTAWTTVKTKTSELWSQIKQAISDTWSSIITTIKTKLDDVIGAIQGLGSRLYDSGKAWVSQLSSGLSAAWNSFMAEVRRKLEEFKNMLPFSEPRDHTSPLYGLGRSGESIVRMIQSGIDRESWHLPGIDNQQDWFDQGYSLGEQIILGMQSALQESLSIDAPILATTPQIAAGRATGTSPMDAGVTQDVYHLTVEQYGTEAEASLYDAVRRLQLQIGR